MRTILTPTRSGPECGNLLPGESRTFDRQTDNFPNFLLASLPKQGVESHHPTQRTRAAQSNAISGFGFWEFFRLIRLSQFGSCDPSDAIYHVAVSHADTNMHVWRMSAPLDLSSEPCLSFKESRKPANIFSSDHVLILTQCRAVSVLRMESGRHFA